MGFVLETCPYLHRVFDHPVSTEKRVAPADDPRISPESLGLMLHIIRTGDEKNLPTAEMARENLSPANVAETFHKIATTPGELKNNHEAWLNACGMLYVFSSLAASAAACEAQPEAEASVTLGEEILSPNSASFFAHALPILDDGKGDWNARIGKVFKDYGMIVPFGNI